MKIGQAEGNPAQGFHGGDEDAGEEPDTRLVDSQLLPAEVLKKKPKDLFSKKGMKWLLSLEWAREADERMVSSHLSLMDVINQEISATNRNGKGDLPARG